MAESLENREARQKQAAEIRAKLAGRFVMCVPNDKRRARRASGLSSRQWKRLHKKRPIRREEAAARAVA